MKLCKQIVFSICYTGISAGLLNASGEEVKISSRTDNSAASSVNGQIQAADILVRQNRYDKALDVYKQALGKCSNSECASGIQLKFGDIYLIKGNNQEAVHAYESVLADKSVNKKYRMKAIEGIFFAHLKNKEYQKAEDSLVDSMKKQNVPSSYLQAEIKRKKQIIQKWKKDAPEKEKIRAIVTRYNKYMEDKNYDAFKGLFLEAISKKRVEALMKYQSSNPSETRTSKDLQIYIYDTGNSATAEFQVDVVKNAPNGNTAELRDCFLKLQREDGVWKISE